MPIPNHAQPRRAGTRPVHMSEIKYMSLDLDLALELTKEVMMFASARGKTKINCQAWAW